MTHRSLNEWPSSNGKMQSLLSRKEKANGPTENLDKTTTNEKRLDKCRKSKRFGEVAGGTAAECAAVCCCCPCTLMNLLVLAIFKMPACLCKKVKKRHRLRKRKQQALLAHSGSNDMLCIEKLEREVRAQMENQKSDGGDDDRENDAVDLEKEMWDQFYATGFWRSPSQRSGTTG